jgi:hypothetical protein
VGLIKDAKQNMLASEAKRAIEEGRTVFAPMLNIPITQSNSIGSIAGWAEMIEGIEACGWQLTHWSVTQDAKGRPQAYPLFRRR